MTLPPVLTGDARERLSEAFAKIAAFALRVEAACGDELACGPGCDSCCQGGLALRAVDALCGRESGWTGGRVAIEELLRAGLYD